MLMNAYWVTRYNSRGSEVCLYRKKRYFYVRISRLDTKTVISIVLLCVFLHLKCCNPHVRHGCYVNFVVVDIPPKYRK